MRHVLLFIFALVATMTALRGAAGFSTVTQILCEDLECKVGCKMNLSFPLGQCVLNPANKTESAMFQCRTAPQQMCFTEMDYNASSSSGSGKCSSSALIGVMDHRCNHCSDDGNQSSMYVCAADGSTVTTKMGCEPGCMGKCAYTHTYKTKECVWGTQIMGAPFRCPLALSGMEWENSVSCGGKAPRKFSTPAGVCSGFNDGTGKTQSSKTVCT